MNDKELQKIIDTKNSTISVLKDTVKKWVREYNMLDACIELQNEKINAYKMSENEANEIIAELKAYKDVNEDFKTAWEELKAENERLKTEIKEKLEIYEKIKDKSAVFTSEFTLASGGVTALKEILELFEKRSNEKVNELEKENKIIRRLNVLSAYDINKLLKKQNKYKSCLQEIETIAERAFAVCDDDCGNANKFKEIIELTKAEEE